jgi:hypothetical protein
MLEEEYRAAASGDDTQGISFTTDIAYFVFPPDNPEFPAVTACVTP